MNCISALQFLNIDWTVQLDYILRVIVGGLLGLIIGIERSYRQKEAGMATHFTVGLAAALFTCISQAMETVGDGARVAAQIVSGISFLGAGMIFFRRESLHGLTTAAGIWATAAIGMCAGYQLYLVAAVVTIIDIAMQIILHTKPLRRHNQRLLLVKFVCSDEMREKLKEYFGITDFSRYKVRRTDGKFEAEAVIRPTVHYTAEDISSFISEFDQVLSVERLEDL